MAGEKQRWTNTDSDWHPKVCELAESLGFERRGVWYWFRQLSLCIFHEAKWPQSCAEAWAWRCVNEIFDKRGAKPS